MKKYILTLSLLNLVQPMFCKVDCQIRPLSNDRIDIEKQELEKAEKKCEAIKKIMRYSALGMTSYFAVSTLYDWYYCSEDKAKKDQAKEFIDKIGALSPERQRQLNDFIDAFKKDKKEKNKVPSDWPLWKKLLYAGTSKTMNLGKSVCSSLAFQLASGIATQLLSTEALKTISKFNDHYLADRSIGWFIERKTSLKIVIKNLMHEINSNKRKSIATDELCSIIDMLIGEFEKILAYMEFTIKKNSIKKRVKVYKRAISIINIIKKDSEKLINKLNNKFIELDKKFLKQDFRSLNVTKYLQNIIDHFEYFNGLEESVGLGDFEERTLFDDIRALINNDFMQNQQEANVNLEDMFKHILSTAN